jgi:hypothetical protein
MSPWLAQRVWLRGKQLVACCNNEMKLSFGLFLFVVRRRAAKLGIETPTDVPSAFQVRLQGCKGVLVVNPALSAATAFDNNNNDDDDDENEQSSMDALNGDELTTWPVGPHVRLRKSMVKFFAPQHATLEVCLFLFLCLVKVFVICLLCL